MQYQEGTVSVTNGSATVTGTGTLWAAAVATGNGFLIPGDNVTYDVAGVNSDTSIQLSAPYAGTTGSGKAYAVHRDFTALGIPEISAGDVGTADLFTRAVRKINDILASLGAT